jgi:hypothetical protein
MSCENLALLAKRHVSEVGRWIVFHDGNLCFWRT